MKGTEEKFTKEITEEIERRHKKYHQLIAIQWIVTILIAVAGVLTTAAGSSQGENQWFASSSALVAWGAITAIGTAISQFANPAKNSEFHSQVKCALKAIRGAVEFRDLPTDQAEQLRVLARTNPEDAIVQLNQWQGPQVA